MATGKTKNTVRQSTVRTTKKRSGAKGKETEAGKTASKPRKEVSASYNAAKQFGARQYTGMRIGGHHTWHYDQGLWKESKLTPDIWRLNYTVMKRRVGKAPQGSGAKVGTGYHWFIFAHQIVEKQNADDYTTSMKGLKVKLAHKRADKGSWNASAAAQRKVLINFLKDMLQELEKQVIPLEFEYGGKEWKGEAVPVPGACHDKVCTALDITLNNEHLGVIRALKNSWKLDSISDQKLANKIGDIIMLYYE